MRNKEKTKAYFTWIQERGTGQGVLGPSSDLSMEVIDYPNGGETFLLRD